MPACQSVISRRKPETKRRSSVITQGFYKIVRHSDFDQWPDKKIRQQPRYRPRSKLGLRDVISRDESSHVKMPTSIRPCLSCCQRRLMYVHYLQNFNKINATKLYINHSLQICLTLLSKIWSLKSVLNSPSFLAIMIV